MEVRIAGTRIAGIADVANDRTLFDELPFDNTVSPGLQMCVIEEKALVRADLVNRDAAGFTIVKLYDIAVSDSYNRRSGGRHYVDRIVGAAL